MMDTLQGMLLGFGTALDPGNLMYAFLGVVLGNLVGVLPGIGPLAAISMLLPITFSIQPAAALMMLAGIYYGAQYGGATTSIMLNLPGVASHAVTCLDGHPMAKKGRAGAALMLAMLASFFGATVGIIIMMFFSPIIAETALKFGPAEYFSMMLLGLLAATTLSQGSAVKGVVMVVLGMVLGVVGTDVNTGVARFTGNILHLYDGISLVALAMGLFGIADVLRSVNRMGHADVQGKGIGWRQLKLTREEATRAVKPAMRGTAIGSFFGVLPGTGSTIASFMSYAVEKKVSKNPKEFGKGAVEGVAGPESANNAAAQTAFIPTMTLGLPGDTVMALMLGAMMIHGITPGPTLISEHPQVFWGLIASFWFGNLMLMVLNIPMISVWVKLLTVPYRFIYPAVLFFICVGVYSYHNTYFDVAMVLIVGVAGYALVRMGFEPAPMLLGFVLGPMVEEYLRRALLLSRGDPMILVQRPLSAVFLAIGLALVLWTMFSWLRHSKKHKAEQAAAVQNQGA